MNNCDYQLFDFLFSRLMFHIWFFGDVLKSFYSLMLTLCVTNCTLLFCNLAFIVCPIPWQWKVSSLFQCSFLLLSAGGLSGPPSVYIVILVCFIPLVNPMTTVCWATFVSIQKNKNSGFYLHFSNFRSDLTRKMH